MYYKEKFTLLISKSVYSANKWHRADRLPGYAPFKLCFTDFSTKIIGLRPLY